MVMVIQDCFLYGAINTDMLYTKLHQSAFPSQFLLVLVPFHPGANWKDKHFHLQTLISGMHRVWAGNMFDSLLWV